MNNVVSVYLFQLFISLMCAAGIVFAAMLIETLVHTKIEEFQERRAKKKFIKTVTKNLSDDIINLINKNVKDVGEKNENNKGQNKD